MSDIRFDIALGISFITVGGWLECMTYFNDVLLLHYCITIPLYYFRRILPLINLN